MNYIVLLVRGIFPVAKHRAGTPHRNTTLGNAGSSAVDGVPGEFNVAETWTTSARDDHDQRPFRGLHWATTRIFTLY